MRRKGSEGGYERRRFTKAGIIILRGFWEGSLGFVQELSSVVGKD